MKDTFCILCQRQEFSSLPNGETSKHDTTGVEDILCSTCTQFCMAKSLGEVPWEGKEQIQEMIIKRQSRKLKTRRQR